MSYGVPTHGAWCVKVHAFPTFCRGCRRRVIYFECTCGSKVFFDPPRGGEHQCNPADVPIGEKDKCIVCGRSLTNPESRQSGVGPVCRERDPKHALLLQTILEEDVNAANKDGVTRLHLFARHAGWVERNPREAAEYRRGRTLDSWLTQPDVKIDARDVAEQTPLHYAAAAGACDAVSMLVARGADINACDGEGNTPAHAAAAKMAFAAMIKLANRGAKTDAKNKGDETSLHLAVRAEAAEIAKRGASGIAATADMPEVVDCFKGAVNIRDKSDITPLHHALSETTIKKLADCRACINASDVLGRTPLHYAVEKESGEAVSTLRDLGANINAQNKRGDSPLSIAEKSGNKKIVELLRRK